MKKVKVLKAVVKNVEIKFQQNPNPRLKLDRIKKIVGFISIYPAIRSNMFAKEIALSVFRNYLKIGTHKLNEYLDWMLLNNIIHRSAKTYNTKNKMKGGIFINDTYRYSIYPPTNLDSFETVEIELPKPKRETYWENVQLLSDDLIVFKEGLDYFELDYKGAIKTVQDEYDREIINTYEKESIFLFNRRREEINKIESLFNKSFLPKRGKYVDRVRSAITSLPSRQHKNLYIEGIRVSEVDARASQLTLLSLETLHIKSKFHEIVQSKESPYSYFHKWIIDFYQKRANNNVLTGKNESLNVMVSHKIGKNKKSICKHYTELTKEDIKVMTWSGVFGSFNAKQNIIVKLFLAEFPEIVEEFHKIVNKKYPNSNLKIGKRSARYLQNVEASIYVDTVIELNKQGIRCTSKHDSILFHFKNVEIIVSTIQNKYLNKYGVHLNDNCLRVELNFESKQFDNLSLLSSPSSVSVLNNNSNKTLLFTNLGENEILSYTPAHRPQSTTKYIFIRDTESTELTISEFINKTKFNKVRVSELVNNKRTMYKGWTIVQPKVLSWEDDINPIIFNIIHEEGLSDYPYPKHNANKVIETLNQLPEFKQEMEPYTSIEVMYHWFDSDMFMTFYLDDYNHQLRFNLKTLQFTKRMNLPINEQEYHRSDYEKQKHNRRKSENTLEKLFTF